LLKKQLQSQHPTGKPC